jgi:hypothetical protein
MAFYEILFIALDEKTTYYFENMAYFKRDNP